MFGFSDYSIWKSDIFVHRNLKSLNLTWPVLLKLLSVTQDTKYLQSIDVDFLNLLNVTQDTKYMQSIDDDFSTKLIIYEIEQCVIFSFSK